MRLSERLVLQAVDDARLVLMDTDSQDEIVLSAQEAGRLTAGVSWFASNAGPALADALETAIADATVIAQGRHR